MATFDQFITSIRTEFGEQGAGKPFEVFCKWFLENDPEWSKTIDKVWLWDDYPNKWQRQDLGTDLVFRDKEGLIWAVQAKCYGEHRTTTKGDMNSFLADTGRKEVDRRLWMQTTNKMEAKAEKTLKGQDKPVTVFNLNSFCDAPLEYPDSFADLYEAKVKPKPTPDTHQVKAIEEATSGLKTSDRGQMIMACGTGKTFTTLWIKEALEAHTTLVLLPSLSLLSQTMREWAWAGNTDFDILNVCSDKSVGKKTEDMDPADASFKVTSNVEKIVEFLQKPTPKVVFCTYQSSDLIAQAQLDSSVPTFDLAVADEAHRCAGKADAGFATILDGGKIRVGKRLFTTATPRYFGKTVKDAAKANDLAVVGMDDEAVFGPVIHKLTFGQAIEQELLTDYQVVIVGVDEPMVREWIENYEIVSTDPDSQTDARTLAAKIGMLKAVKDYDLRRVISFHSRVAGAKQFSDELVNVANLIEPANRPEGTFLSDYVSGEMKAGDRKEKIDRLKVLEGYDRGILTNARCLAEGVDVPSLDGVAFIDPRGSQVEIIQAVGRAIRRVRGAAVQKKGTIVLPVFIEDGDNHEASIEASNFKPVWDVLKALRAHDEVLASTLDEYRTNIAKNASQSRERISDKIIFDMPVSVDAEFSSALRTVLVEASTASWEFWYGLLEVYKNREGHCGVQRGHKENCYNLGNWVGNQRARKATLPSDQFNRLEALEFVWDANAQAWEEGFNYLQSFKGREGHCRVPVELKEDGYNLGWWAGTQRNSKLTMPPDRRQRLEDLGFVWDLFAQAWEDGFSYLQSFKDREGHCRVPKELKESGFSLGTWVSKQRKTKHAMSPERQKRLDALGFVWNSLELAWEEGFNKILQFKEREGHCLVPAKHLEEGFRLGGWVREQRLSQAKMSPDRIQTLNNVGFVWDHLNELWEEGFLCLQAFVAREGHCRVSATHKERGHRLGHWVKTQRGNRDKLSSTRKKRLEEIGFAWVHLDGLWEEGFFYLEAFVAREGHCRVTKNHQENGFKLGLWVRNQRSNQNNLNADRKQRLDDLFFVWSVNDSAWEEGFRHLQAFYDREGNCLVAANLIENDFKLGVWVGTQRTNIKQISSEKRERLEALDFVWDPYESSWNRGFEHLKLFVLKEGHCLVPQSFHTEGFNLGTWVTSQRSKKTKLAPHKIEQLNSLDFVWDTIEHAWQEGLRHLEAYKKREGHCLVHYNHREGDFSLGSWVKGKRLRQKSLSTEKRQRLDQLGFIWDTSKGKT